MNNKLIHIQTYEQFSNESLKSYPPIPKIVYHGQPPTYDKANNYKRVEPVKFTSFDQKYKRFLNKDNYGFYFTTSKREAYDYAEGGNVYVCEVNLKNPYYFENIFNYTNEGLIKSATFISKEDKQKLIDNGYDGVILLDTIDNIGEVIALYPEQIKIIEILK